MMAVAGVETGEGEEVQKIQFGGKQSGLRGFLE